MMRQLLLLSIASLFLTTPVLAQDSGDDRIGQLEEDVLLLKRQLERARLAGSNGNAQQEAPAGGEVGTAQTNIRITNLEEEIRSLRGQIEQKDFETRRISEDFEKFKKDAEFRMTELEGKVNAAPPAVDMAKPKADAAPAEEKPAEKETKEKPGKKPEVSVKEVPEDSVKPAAETPAEDTAPAAAGDTPRDMYNYAFRQLNQNQYDEAAKSFAAFSKKYPKDPLVGNAFYWQGETFYIRKDYNKAADLFRQGFESMPKGPKAADNLLKLGMSLGALKKEQEACIVLTQVMNKYKTASANVAAKAESEHKKLGCE